MLSKLLPNKRKQIVSTLSPHKLRKSLANQLGVYAEDGNDDVFTYEFKTGGGKSTARPIKVKGYIHSGSGSTQVDLHFSCNSGFFKYSFIAAILICFTIYNEKGNPLPWFPVVVLLGYLWESFAYWMFIKEVETKVYKAFEASSLRPE